MDVTAFQTRLFRLSAACIILFLCAFFNREKRVWIVFFHSDLSVSLSSADDGNLLMFPAFHNVEQSDQKSGFQKDMYSLFLQIDTILHTAKGKR